MGRKPLANRPESSQDKNERDADLKKGQQKDKNEGIPTRNLEERNKNQDSSCGCGITGKHQHSEESKNPYMNTQSASSKTRKEAPENRREDNTRERQNRDFGQEAFGRRNTNDFAEGGGEEMIIEGEIREDAENIKERNPWQMGQNDLRNKNRKNDKRT